MVRGVNQVVLEVEDQERALGFWTQKLEFEVTRDAPYGEGRWIEVRGPDRGVQLVLSLRHGERPMAPDFLPTSNVHFYCDDLVSTYDTLRARGVAFPQRPVEQPWGWWSMFEDEEGNRFALTPLERR
jgi:lactoylglutathione lyase